MLALIKEFLRQILCWFLRNETVEVTGMEIETRAEKEKGYLRIGMNTKVGKGRVMSELTGLEIAKGERN